MASSKRWIKEIDQLAWSLYFFLFVFWCVFECNCIRLYSFPRKFGPPGSLLWCCYKFFNDFSVTSCKQTDCTYVAIEKSLLRRRLERWKIWQINWSTFRISWTLSRVNEKKFYTTGVWHNQRCIKTHIFLICKLILQGNTVLELHKRTGTSF